MAGFPESPSASDPVLDRNVATVDGTSYTLPANYRSHWVYITQNDTTIELPSAAPGTPLVTFISQPSGGSCTYSFANTAVEGGIWTPPSESSSGYAVDIYNWMCYASGAWWVTTSPFIGMFT